MELSTCCDAPRWRDLESDICEACKEHADFVEEDSEDENIEFVMPFTFKWKTTIVSSHEKSIPIEDVVGYEVFYQPNNEHGNVVKKDGVIVIEWDDDAPDTILDTEKGREIIAECEIN